MIYEDYEDYEVLFMTSLHEDLESMEICNPKQYKQFSCIYHNELEIKYIEDLVNLIEVYFNRNHISKIENISHLKYLQCLGLSDNRIKKIEGLSGLLYLKIIDLDDNEIEDIEGLNGLINLHTVHLCMNNISDMEGLEDIGINQITNLHLDYNDIRTIENLEYLPKLKYFTIKGNKITTISTASLDHINKNGIAFDIDDEYNIINRLNNYAKESNNEETI